MSAKHDPDQDPYCLDSSHDDLAAQVSSLTAENERLRKRLEAAWDRADEDGNQKVSMFVENRKLKAEVSSLRELESAARAYVAADRKLGGLARIEAGNALAAAVDALPPTPPATEGSDDTA